MQTRDARHLGEKTSHINLDGEQLAAETAKALEAYQTGDPAPLKALVAEHGMHLPGMKWDMHGASYAVEKSGAFRRTTPKINKHMRKKNGLGKVTNAEVKASIARFLQDQVAAAQATKVQPADGAVAA